MNKKDYGNSGVGGFSSMSASLPNSEVRNFLHQNLKWCAYTSSNLLIWGYTCVFGSILLISWEKGYQAPGEILSLEVLKKKFRSDHWTGNISMEALTHSQDFRCTLQVLGIQINDLDVPSDLRCMHLLPSRFFTSAPGISNRVCPETHGVKLIIPPILPAFENDHPHSYVNQTTRGSF